MNDWVAIQTKEPARGQTLQVKFQPFLGRNQIMQGIGYFAENYFTDDHVVNDRGTLNPPGAGTSQLDYLGTKAILLHVSAPVLVEVKPLQGVAYTIDVQRTLFLDQPTEYVRVLNTGDTSLNFTVAAALEFRTL